MPNDSYELSALDLNLIAMGLNLLQIELQAENDDIPESARILLKGNLYRIQELIEYLS
jgi:hypothetical protein